MEVKSPDKHSIDGVVSNHTIDNEVNNLTDSQTLQVRDALAIVLPELEAGAEP